MMSRRHKDAGVGGARHGHIAVMLLVMAVCAFSASSCSAGGAPYASLIVKHESVLLVPDLNAGRVGWCVTGPNGGVCPTGRVTGPVIAESWSSSEGRSVGYAITAGQVMFVSVDGGPAIRTRREPALRYGLRAVAVAVTGLRGGRSPGFIPLNIKKEQIPLAKTPSGPLSVMVATKALLDPAHPIGGVCGIEATSLAGLIVQGGRVINHVRAYRLKQAFISCASTAYRLDGWSPLAGVLLDTARPGSTPASLPGMRPVAGHPSIFEAPGFEGEMTARRVPGAWLAVSRMDPRLRLALLEHIRATVRT